VSEKDTDSETPVLASLQQGGTSFNSSTDGFSSSLPGTLEDANEASSVMSLTLSGHSAAAPQTDMSKDGWYPGRRILLQAVPPTLSEYECSISSYREEVLPRSRFSVSSDSSGSDYGEEDSCRGSIDFDDSVLTYSRVRNLVERLDAENESEQSLDLPRAPSPSHRERDRRPDMQASLLFLSQPDGNNPWTLSLDPSQVVDSVSVVQSSISSLSVASSSTSYGEQITRTMPLIPSITSSSRSPSPVSPPVQVEDPRRQGVDFPTAELLDQEEIDFPFYTIGRTAYPPQPRTVVQKTKSLYTKVKKLLSSKSSKTGSSKIIDKTPSTPRNIDLTTFSTPNASQFNSISNQTPVQRPFYRRPFTKCAATKPSYHPTTLTQMPEIPYPFYADNGGALSMVHQESHTYENYVRPKTTEDIKATKAKRRFSLPAAFSGSSSRPGTSASAGWTLNPLSNGVQNRIHENTHTYDA